MRDPRHLARATATRALHRVLLDEEHVWHQLDLPAPAGPRLDPGLTLVSPADATGLAPLRDLPTLSPAHALRRMSEGGQPWLVLDSGAALFACWLFRDTSPMIAAPGGWLAVPERCVVLEDSVAAPAARGRGIGPRTWGALADRLAGEGREALLTKVETVNGPSRRAVAKAGFREIAIMRLRRRGPVERVEVEVLDAESRAGELRTRLARPG